MDGSSPTSAAALAAEVLSTPGMIGMMERTAACWSVPRCDDGKATVGFEVNVKHVGAAQKGDHCKVHAKLEEIVDGRKLRFAVEVTAQDGRTIGVGRHERRIIDVGQAPDERDATDQPESRLHRREAPARSASGSPCGSVGPASR